MKEEIIRQVPLFAELPSEEIHHLAETLESSEVPPGELLMKEGEKGTRFFILLDGEVEIIKALGTPDERLLSVLKTGAFIGEMSLFNKDGLRTASVRTISPSKLLVLTREEFNALLHRQPILAYDMVGVLTNRLQEANEATITDLRTKNVQLTKAYKELEAAQAQLIEKERLEKELEVARRIQMSILPKEHPRISEFTFSTLISPMTAVGGDFYDLIPLENNSIGVAVGDVSDHGVAAALFMALTATLLRAEAKRSASPMLVLQSVNQQLLEMNEAQMFVTLFYGILDLKNYEFRYARAGHELPLLMNHDEAIEPLDAGKGYPLGILDDLFLTEQKLSMKPDDTLLIYTDGVTDTENKQGKNFGVERLQGALRNSRNSPSDLVCQDIFATIRDFMGNQQQTDDITLLSVKTASA